MSDIQAVRSQTAGPSSPLMGMIDWPGGFPGALMHQGIPVLLLPLQKIYPPSLTP
ncbi:hypothetical protein J4Q44_G00036390 [Coregonus suidteri]|uniref:Uncharacterized protein n=1 Tax=Coregonus suidteri TaxID=861788 RepID=A0AAN8R8E0_9TELE